MPFKKGHKHGKGRPRGAKNKKSLLARDEIEALGVNLMSQILARIPKLSPELQAKYLIELLPYVYPKLTAVEMNIHRDDSSIDLKDVSDADLDAILVEAPSDDDH